MRRPPDHLVVEYYAGETKAAKDYKGERANIGFKYNIFNHLGKPRYLSIYRYYS